MSSLLNLIKNDEAVELFCNNKNKQFITDDVIGTSLLVCSRYNTKPEKIVVVASNLYNSQRIYDFVSNIIGENECLFYPSDDLLRNESVAESKEMIAQRLYIMHELETRDNYILVTHVSALMKYLPSPELFKENCLHFKVGDTLDLKNIKNKLVAMGYVSVHKIDHSLQFANRGDIIDIFSVNNDNPIRIELFDDQIESIRQFSIETQTSIGEIKEILILPANEYLLTQNELDNTSKKIRYERDLESKQLSDERQSCFFANINIDLDSYENSSNKKLVQKYYSFLQDNHHSLLDYTKDSVIVLSNTEQIENTAKIVFDEAEDFLAEEIKDLKVLQTISVYQNYENLIKKYKNIINIHEFALNKDAISFQVSSIAGVATTLNQAFDLIKTYLDSKSKVIVCVDNVQQYEIIKSILTSNEVKFEEISSFSTSFSQLGIMINILDEGFDLIKNNLVVLTSKELFSFKTKSSKYANRYKQAVALKSEQDLVPGDYVVHENHGVGRFIDVVTLDVDGIHRDFIHIQYAGTDVLYVPLEQFKLIRKFSGKEGAVPKLNKLGSGEWEKTKNKIKERINEMADRLFKLYSEREQVKGFAFKKDDEFQFEFERQFPYALTDDQQKCIDEIKRDMEKSEPMDRLLCGDVGFGKTEIAFRAAFKAILSGKQVAILCPTTLLARQHYERALERFGPFDVRIAVFSRLVDDQRMKMYQKQVESGEAHLIIGTHSILSKNMHFKNLGLLIVDEEQRFGVEQKERIKELKTNIDVLTLTATPIPRTLQMSLLGIRSLSQINTPPENRMPIQTYVMPQKDDVVYELISRELARKGQVFYLHNNVSTIYSTAIRIEKKLKGSVVGVVHGQMSRDEIEDIMLKFYNGEIDILVCTSIIETGIDIPNVNMIVIEDANNFGLSQLYQIKGRVGRGNRIAYAYLLYKPNKVINEKARKRLKAIMDFTELGSGYKIAQRDLLIRGAGDILGPEQAGFIDTVGLDMYMQLLKETIEERQTGIKQSDATRNVGNISIDAYLPNEYVEKIDKIDLYQEIENVKSIEELKVLRAKIRDLYGRFPESVERLFEKREILFIIENNKSFDRLVEESNALDLYLSKEFSNLDGVGMSLFKALTNYLRYIKVTYVNRQIRIRLFKADKWFGNLKSIVDLIANLESSLNN